jgi:type IV pilus biogenesis protein CpaD/CtpE
MDFAFPAAARDHYRARHWFAIDGANQKFENPISHSSGKLGEKEREKLYKGKKTALLETGKPEIRG